LFHRGHLFWPRYIGEKLLSTPRLEILLISKRQVVHGATGIISRQAEWCNRLKRVSRSCQTASNRLLTEFLTILASLPDMRRKFFLSSYGVDIEKLFFDAEDWKKRNVTIPGINEQTQIGEYFRELDSLIGCISASMTSW
jgi:type I restriction enzyme S subunit